MCVIGLQLDFPLWGPGGGGGGGLFGTNVIHFLFEVLGQRSVQK